ncbi:MBL fold metallo-hydrolase [Cellulomonas sp. DKR-3]|uniref:MBL fold metallo-hydrolase n=1 Tax=Cellulomonas fulva TaxID=2835530 RepID=A0ABS5TX62_9CELL|nr:MBL fold metallo-hydrolase [Cellulomonas fulva]MBT0993743.1 MBL fold metallo-hydrolase [Cellulomonas fulva]
MTVVSLHGHACARFERDGRVLVVDPGGFSEPDATAGADAVLVTHEHADHVVPDRLTAELAADPTLEVWAPQPVVEALVRAGADEARVHALAVGDEVEAAGFAVRALGGRHATIHPDLPVPVNLALLVDGRVLHPGDSLTQPPADVPVELLLLPVSAPWLKLAEAVDYLRAVAPTTAVPIHDAILSDAGKALVDRVSKQLAGDGTTYRRLAPGETLTLG